MSTRTSSRAVVGRIAYLNTDPFFEGLALGPGQEVAVPPRELARLCREGQVDAGAIPVGELFRMDDRFEPLGQLGIACTGPVGSVLAFSRVPFERLDGAAVALAAESATSVRLLRLLLEQALGVRPAGYRRGGTEGAQAYLVIGDAALRQAFRGVPGFPHTMDLSEAWHRWQGMPFVFARWAVRRSLPEAVKAELAAALDRALERGLQNAAGIAARRAPEIGVPAAELEAYLHRMTLRLGPAEARGEAQFRRLIDQHGLADFDPQ